MMRTCAMMRINLDQQFLMDTLKLTMSIVLVFRYGWNKMQLRNDCFKNQCIFCIFMLRQRWKENDGKQTPEFEFERLNKIRKLIYLKDND